MSGARADKVRIVRTDVEREHLQVVICDDEKTHLEELTLVMQPLMEREKISVETFLSPGELMETLQKRREEGKSLPEIILIDIVMPEMDGITLAKTIRKVAPDSYLIFTTAYAEYAIQGYEARAFRYLLKPVTTEQMEILFREIRMEMRKDRKLVVNNGDGEYIVNLEEVMYISAEDKYTVLYTANGHFVDRASLNDYEELLNPYGFIRIHRKYIVNVTYHKCISRRNVVLKDGTQLPMSFRREKDYRKKLFWEMDGEVLN